MRVFAYGLLLAMLACTETTANDVTPSFAVGPATRVVWTPTDTLRIGPVGAPGFTIKGTALDAAGQPVPGIVLGMWESADFYSFSGGEFCTTGADGSCSKTVSTTGTGTRHAILRHYGGSATRDTVQVKVTATAPGGGGEVTLRAVGLTPQSATVQTGGSQQFTATDSMSDGSTRAFAGTWSATGGTITSGGLYTAGSTAGSFQAIALESGKSDTAAITVTDAPPPPPPPPPGTLARGCPTSGYTRLVNVNTKAQLDAAFSAAVAGDQIRLASGTYSGTTNLTRSGTAANPITVCGVAGVGPIMTGGRFKLVASYVVVTGIVFAGPNGSDGNVWLAGGDHSQFVGNECRNSAGHYCVSAENNSNLRIAYNNIHDNGAGPEIDHGIYYRKQIGSGNVIDNNLITRSTGRGISLHDNTSSNKIENIRVLHNTITRNGSTGILLATNGGAGNVVANNILADNGLTYNYKQVRLRAGTGTNGNSVLNNITWSPVVSKQGVENGGTNTVSGNLSSDPNFVTPYTDLHLQAGSPAIGLGLTSYSVSPDYDGNARDGSPDAGAFERP
jgi:parallel beta helix pectate lyase-like protein